MKSKKYLEPKNFVYPNGEGFNALPVSFRFDFCFVSLRSLSIRSARITLKGSL